LDLLCKPFPSLAGYIKKFEFGTPDFFDSIENRCPQIKIDVKIKKGSERNIACKLADFALKTCDKNRERHSAVENFMLVNDSSTIACEIPIWFWEKNLDIGICGHIDLLQVRNDNIYVMDLKPGASKENEKKVSSQLYLYASGLSFRTSIPLDRFRCAWFDECIYYEFSPKEAEVRFANSKYRSKNFGKKKRILDPNQAADLGKKLARIGRV
jgi:hypothetical protein